MSSSREQEIQEVKETPNGASPKLKKLRHKPSGKPKPNSYSRVESSDDEVDMEIVGEEKGGFNSLSLTPLHGADDLSLQVSYDTFETLAAAANKLIDRQQAMLTRDAKEYKDALDKSAAQEALLNKARTSVKNIDTAIRKFESEIINYSKKLEQQLEELSEAECARINSRREKAYASLLLSRQRHAKVKRAISRIQNSMEKLQSNKKAASEKFISHFPLKAYAYEKLFLSYLCVDLLFTSYVFVASALSFQDFAKAWKISEPSTELSFSLILVPALMDLAFNMLLINIHEDAVGAVYADYDKYRFKSYRRIVTDYLTNITQNLSVKSVALATLNRASISAHNLVGASADLVGIKDFLVKLGGWQLILDLPIVAAGNGYYGLTQNAKYHAGMKNNQAYSQVASAFRKLFSRDFTRAFDVIYRGVFSTAALRAFSFYYIAAELKTLAPDTLYWINPAVVTALVFHHTIQVRFGKAYTPTFQSKEETLVNIFKDLKINKARAKIIEQRINAIYEVMATANETLDAEDRSSVNTLRQKASEQFYARKTTAVTADIEHEALKQAADMDHDFPVDARLSIDRVNERALIRLTRQARIDAQDYLEDQTHELLELRTWNDTFVDFRSSFIIGTLRALFGYLVISTYGFKLIDAIDNDVLSGNTAEFVRYTTSIACGLLMMYIYYQSRKEMTMDDAVAACFIEDVTTIDDDLIAAAENAIAQTDAGATNTPMAETATNEDNNSRILMATTIRVAQNLAIVITAGSSVIRLVSMVGPVDFAFIGSLDDLVLVSLVTLTAAEGSINNYDTFIDMIEKSIRAYLLNSKWLYPGKVLNSAPEEKVAIAVQNDEVEEQKFIAPESTAAPSSHSWSLSLPSWLSFWPSGQKKPSAKTYDPIESEGVEMGLQDDEKLYLGDQQVNSHRLGL
jgi:hypothetical protein